VTRAFAGSYADVGSIQVGSRLLLLPGTGSQEVQVQLWRFTRGIIYNFDESPSGLLPVPSRDR